MIDSESHEQPQRPDAKTVPIAPEKPASAALIESLTNAPSPRGALEVLAGEKAGAQPPEERKDHREREESSELIQNKIISIGVLAGKVWRSEESFEGARKYVLAKSDVPTSPAEREKYLKMVRDGVDGIKPENIIPYVKGPDNSEDALAEKFDGMDDQMKGIIAHFGLGELSKRDTLGSDDVQAFLSKTDAMTFAKNRDVFLGIIAVSNGSGKREKYEAAYDKVGQQLYGKQWEYLKQMQVLEEESGAKNIQKAPEQAPPPVAPVQSERNEPIHNFSPQTEQSLPDELQEEVYKIQEQQDWIHARLNKLRPTARAETMASGGERYLGHSYDSYGDLGISFNTDKGDEINGKLGDQKFLYDLKSGSLKFGNPGENIDDPRYAVRDGKLVKEFLTYPKSAKDSSPPDIRTESVTDPGEISLVRDAFMKMQDELGNPVSRFIKKLFK